MTIDHVIDTWPGRKWFFLGSFLLILRILTVVLHTSLLATSNSLALLITFTVDVALSDVTITSSTPQVAV
jgi:hypothetical protein